MDGGERGWGEGKKWAGNVLTLSRRAFKIGMRGEGMCLISILIRVGQQRIAKGESGGLRVFV